MASVLIVEDGESLAMLRKTLEASRHTVPSVRSASEVLPALERAAVDVVVLDVEAAPAAIEVLSRIKERGLSPEVIVISGQASVALVSESFRRGAFDFFEKPAGVEVLATAVHRAVDARQRKVLKADALPIGPRASWHQALFETSPIAQAIYEQETFRFLSINRAMAAQYGYEREELLGLTVKGILHPDEPRNLAQLPDGYRLVRHGVSRHVRKDGRVIDVDVVTHGVRFEGRWVRLATLNEVTEKRKLEQALEASETSFRSLVDSSPDQVWLFREERIVYANDAAVRGVGFDSAEELIGRSILEFVPPEDRDATRGRAAAAASLEAIGGSRELRLLHRDGTTRTVDSKTLSLVFDGRQTALCVARDVTDRRQMEARLRAADRMASVGTLAAGVAHEINNPLAYVLANLQFALEELEGGLKATRLADVLDALRDSQFGLRRVQTIVGDLKTFSRGEVDRAQPVDLNAAVGVALNLAANEIRHRASLKKELAENLPRINANEGQLGQVFLNLLVNAAQSIQPGAASRHQIVVRTGVEPSGAAVFAEVSDTGSGIPPEIRPRLFDPFFTTKDVGEGTGLGLSICQGIVTALGGQILVASELGRGSTFRVVLPVNPADEPGAAP